MKLHDLHGLLRYTSDYDEMALFPCGIWLNVCSTFLRAMYFAPFPDSQSNQILQVIKYRRRKRKNKKAGHILRTGGNRSEGQSEIAPKQEVRLRRLPISPFNNNYWLVHPTSHRRTTASDLRS